MYSSLVCGYSVFGFSGSRSCPVACGLALGLLGYVSPRASIYVGCAEGVDACIRAASLARPVAPVVFRAASFAASSFRGSLVRRSEACIKAVAAVSGLWCAFPSSDCPDSIRPDSSVSACFSGAGSGTWASIAYAVGIGCAVLVCVPSHVTVPTWVLRCSIMLSERSGRYYYLAPTTPPRLF